MTNEKADAHAPDRVTIRRGTEHDAAVIAHHRTCMFRDMGRVDDNIAPALLAESARWAERAVAAGEYAAWLAYDDDAPDRILAGGGALLRIVPPYPVGAGTSGGGVAAGRSAHFVNVYVEPEARRQGLARRIMREMLAWCEAERIDEIGRAHV